MQPDEAVPELTSDLDYWEITLKPGEMATLRAHAMSEQDGAYVFVALMKGSPPTEYELARVPSEVVDDVEGGWTTPRT